MTAPTLKKSPKAWQWYDLSKAGLFIAPEKVCGQSCLVLLDTTAFFQGDNRLQLIKNGFMPFIIEDDPNISSHLYISFVDNLNIELFYTKLGVPIGSIKSVQLTLSEIQHELYKRALQITNYRIDLLLKTTSILGRNNNNEVVYNSHFGRFIIDNSADVQTYLLENIYDERFLHASNNTALISCVEGYIKHSLKHKIKLTAKDLVKFASIVYQKKGSKIDTKLVQPSDLYQILEVFDFVYTKNIPYIYESDTALLNDRNFFNLICELYECQPLKPSNNSKFILNSHSTPTPISYVAQRLLVDGDVIEDKVILNPMFGYGSLTNFLTTHPVHISALEENPNKTDLISCTNIPRTMVKLACAISENLIDYNSMSLYDYIISCPSTEIIDDQYCFEDGLLEPLYTQRKDHILVLKSLICRENIGRSVYILQLHDEDQDALNNDLNKLLQFISSRYKIDGLTRISGELYCQNSLNSDVLLLVIGEKFEKLSYSQNTNFIAYISQTRIEDYQSLWVWGESICYLRSKEHTKNNEVLDRLADQENESFLNKVNDELTFLENSTTIEANNLDNAKTQNDESNAIDEQRKSSDAFEGYLTGTENQKTAPEDNWQYEGGVEGNDALFGFNDLPNTNETVQTNSLSEQSTTESVVHESSNTSESQNEAKLIGISMAGLDDGDLATGKENENIDKTNANIDLSKSDDSNSTKAEQTNTSLTTTEETTALNETSSKDSTETSESDNSKSSQSKDQTKVSLSKNQSSNLSKDEEFILEKVAENNGTLFDTNSMNAVIRSHSISVLGETVSNVRLNNFSSSLKAKTNLLAQILSTFEVLDSKNYKDQDYVKAWNNRAKKLNEYTAKYKCSPSIDSFVSCFLQTEQTSNLKSFYLVEHIDAIAIAILRSQRMQSVFLLDSPGLMPEYVMAALIRYSMLNNMIVMYVARNLESFNRLYDAWLDLQEALPIATEVQFKVINFFSSNDLLVKDLDKNQILVLTQDEDSFNTVDFYKSQIYEKFKSNSKLCLFETHDENSKLPSTIRKIIDESPTLYVSNRFIRPESDFKLYRSLFTSDLYQRYFASPISDLDEVGCDLLKSSLIEDGVVIERLEDLSNLDVQSIQNGVNKQVIYERVSEIFTVVLNKIVELAEVTRKYSAQDESSTENYIDFDFRTTALEIFKYANFCLKSETITQTIVDAIKNHSKPIIVFPNNLENMLYQLLQFEIQIDDQNNLCALNELIETKSKEIEKQSLITEITGDYTGYAQLSAEINELVQKRSIAVSKYLLFTISGTEKKLQPQVSDLLELFFIQATLVKEHSGDLFKHSYKSVIRNEVRELYTQIKELILKLPSIPLMMLDNIKYDLGKFNINIGEISTRTIALKKTDSIDIMQPTAIWSLDSKQPYQEKLIKQNDEISIIHAFNSGYIDVLFVEAEEVSNFNLASINYAKFGVPSDHYRQRVLMFTHFDINIESILRMINTVNKREQWVQPSLRFIVGESFGERISYNLITQQLALYSVRNDTENNEFNELTFYLTNIGKNCLNRYLSLNPDMQYLMPQKPLNTWTIFDLVNFCLVKSNPNQIQLFTELLHFYKSYLHYLKNINAHPFELYLVKPKARLRSLVNVNNPLRMHQPIQFNSKFSDGINGITLEYLKDKSQIITPDNIIGLQESSFIRMRENLKRILPEGLYKGVLAQDLNTYTAQLEALILAVYKKHLKNILLDGKEQWKFKGTTLENTKTAKMYFGYSKTKKAKINIIESIDQIGKNIATLYIGLELVGSIELRRSFEEAYQILTYLKCFTLTVAEMASLPSLSPIIMNVPSPYRDDKTKQDEGLLLGINLPKISISALFACSYKCDFIYPQKSKAKEINLAYVLDHRSVLGDQSIIAEIPPDLQTFVTKAFSNALDKEQVKFKLSKFNNDSLKRFALVSDYGEAKSAPIMKAFKEPENHIVSRKMDIFFGNSFEIYYTLKSSIPITTASFTDPSGCNQIGFIIPPEIEMKSVMLCLEESVNLPSMKKIVEKIIKKEAWYNFPVIQFVNRNTSLTVLPVNEDELQLSLKGQDHELQSILLDQRIFYENSNGSLGLSINFDQTSYSGNKTVLKTNIKFKDLPDLFKILIDAKHYQLSILRSCKTEIRHRYFNNKNQNRFK